jgi:hypothetical protein
VLVSPLLVRDSQRTGGGWLGLLEPDAPWRIRFGCAKRVPDGFAFEDGKRSDRTKKAVRHARQRPAASSPGVFLERSWRALVAMLQVFARRLRGLLVLLLILELVLLLPFKNACVLRRVAGHAHFYCLLAPWLHYRFRLRWEPRGAGIEQPAAHTAGNSPG